jgi:hypothetical protein
LTLHTLNFEGIQVANESINEDSLAYGPIRRPVSTRMPVPLVQHMITAWTKGDEKGCRSHTFSTETNGPFSVSLHHVTFTNYFWKRARKSCHSIHWKDPENIFRSASHNIPSNCSAGASSPREAKSTQNE